MTSLNAELPELTESLNAYIDTHVNDLRAVYEIDENQFAGDSIKRGLRNSDGSGVLAGVTRVSSIRGYYMDDGRRVPIPGEYYYRGVSVRELVESQKPDSTFGFEEASYLLLFGSLPNREEFNRFRTALDEAQTLPTGFFEDMILRCPSPSIMNQLSRSVLALYSYDENPDDTGIENMVRQSMELIARFPAIVAASYAVRHHYYDGGSLYIHRPKNGMSLPENILRLVRRDKHDYTLQEVHLLDTMLMIHAEHGGGNNSAFACRTVSSSGTDTYSCIAAAVGSLKGPLHGGANAKVLEMVQDIKENVPDWTSEKAVGDYLDLLLDRKAGDRTGKIYGIGHAIYTLSDPRAEMIKKCARELVEEKGRVDDFQLLENIERLATQKIQARRRDGMPVCANVDLYSGMVYSMLGIPQELFTPLFATARVAGWCAHRIEEAISGRRLIRPAYRSAVQRRPCTPMEERP